ncbi:MAG TPA: hypothetical protein VLD19_08630, partial [Chitinophagaceae bacterium]|nr:hypothetical protein [Chitinophagaceae bacterium]
MNPSLRKWLHISLFNLLLVALAGVVLRYKIAWSLPIVNQKYLLHGHSHFAFAGWATQALMALLVAYLQDKATENVFTKYRVLLYANLLSAYGMLCTFPFEGYAAGSIFFSMASILVSYLFAVQYWRDLNRLKIHNCCHSWFKGAIAFNALSSLGVFSLAWMMATRHIHTEGYLLSVYFFLHFQYNGWFFFACMGLLSYQLHKNGVDERHLGRVSRLFLLACIPAFFLSALWLPVPGWVYALVVVAGISQLAAWLLLLGTIKNHWLQLSTNVSLLSRRLFSLWALAVTIKLCLQAGSVIPSLSQLAFGFRPIVIGYLHLVLLGVITLFILSYAVTLRFIHLNKI